MSFPLKSVPIISLLLIASLVGGGVIWNNTQNCDVARELGIKENNTTSELPPISIATDKENYEYGEPIRITVARGDYPSRDEEAYLILFGGFVEIERGGPEIKRFIIGTNEIGKNENKVFVWDYVSENTLISPGEYYIRVYLGVADLRGSEWEGIYYFGIGASTKISILWPNVRVF